MCVISNVMDYYRPMFPEFVPSTPTTQPTFTLQPTVDLAELRKLIEEFKEATKAARTVDRLTGQADCIDPEKGRLEARVAELEAQLAKIREAAATA